MHDKFREIVKEYNADICEEVRALLDRMDKFPDEFIEDRLNNKWYRVRQALDSEEEPGRRACILAQGSLPEELYQLML